MPSPGCAARHGGHSVRAAAAVAAVAALAAFGTAVAAAAADGTSKQPRAAMTYYDDERCGSKKRTSVVVDGACAAARAAQPNVVPAARRVCYRTPTAINERVHPPHTHPAADQCNAGSPKTSFWLECYEGTTA
jgi:hypothetical protein